MTDQTNPNELLALTADIVAAHVGSNSVPVGDLPQLIGEVYRTLATLGAHGAIPVRPDPAVPVKKSITPDYIICLEDGKKLKMLKRHLKSSYGLSPDEYRTKWGLPSDYPMVAPNYAKARSEMAVKIGLGRRA